jgi:hypothetical protein
MSLKIVLHGSRALAFHVLIEQRKWLGTSTRNLKMAQDFVGQVNIKRSSGEVLITLDGENGDLILSSIQSNRATLTLLNQQGRRL